MVVPGLGLFRLLAAVTFGIAIPYGLCRLSRAFGLPLVIAGAMAIGIAYGAIKADNPWAGEGLAANLRIIGVSAFALAAYVSGSVWVAGAIRKRL
jgi:hypothetical protein